MAQRKDLEIPVTETLTCFQAAEAKPTSPSQSLNCLSRSGDIQLAGAAERTDAGEVSSEKGTISAAAASMLVVNRCSGCRRKVGLTGFRCRCGERFCGEHRYSDRHDCTFDYKAAGRIAISRENPLVRASKILRI